MLWLRTCLNGGLPLGRTFLWLGILPRLIIWSGLALLERIAPQSLLALVLLAPIDIALWAVQLRGYSRASESHIRSHGGMIAVWGGYLGLLVLAAFSVTLWWGAMLTALTRPEAESYSDQAERLRRESYEIGVSEGGRTLRFTGDITFGLTRRAATLIDENPDLVVVILESSGGHIYEARGFAGLIHKVGLSTHVDGECSSACTLMFIAGHRRSLGPEGRLGFHQYALENTATPQSVNIAGEQEKDRALFRRQGVRAGFLDRMFTRSGRDLWYPDRTTLTADGVLTQQ